MTNRKGIAGVLDDVVGRIDSKRLERGMNQDEFAAAAGLAGSTISRLFRREYASPSVETVMRSAVALDCEPSELLPSLAGIKQILAR